MSKPIVITDSVTLHPSGYDSSTLQAYSTSNIDRGYNSSSNTTYAQINLTRNANAVTNIDYTFSLPSGTIPSGSTINSVTCTAKCSINNTQSSRISSRTIQLYSGSTAKGDAYTVANSTTAFSITAGSWTLSELQTSIRIKLHAVRGTSSTTSSYYFRFYGCDFTINYTYSGVEYEITASSTASGVTVDPASEDVLSGGSFVLQIEADNSNPVIAIDNGVDVSSQLVEHETEYEEGISGYTGNSNFTLTNIENAYHKADNTTYAQLQTAGSTTGTIYFTFPSPSLPSGATLQSVSCSATFQYNRNGSSSGYSAACRMYYNTTAKGSETTITTTGGSDMAKTTFNLSPGSWTLSELSNARLYVTATNSARSTVRYLYVYGATLTIEYLYSGKSYTYTIASVTADHTIVVSQGASGATLYFKVNGSWVAVASAYRKVNGSWVQQSDVSTVFQSGVNYVKGN